jgi:hypothetical protein
MYPHGQSSLPDDPVTAYVNNPRTTGAASGSATTRRPPTTQPRDPSRGCYVCVASASSSSDPEPAPRHRATDSQRRACLDALVEARRQLDEELANFHWELREDLEPRNRQPAQLLAPQLVPVQEQPREGNDKRQECRPAAEQPRAHAPTLPARGHTHDNDRRANEGANVDANTDGDAPLLFRRASQNLAAAAMLLCGCLEAATSEER